MKFDPLIDLKIVHSILDFLPMGVCVLSGERKIQWVNERVTHRFGMEKNYSSGEKFCYREIFKREEPCPDCPVLKTLKSGRMEHGEVKSEHHGQEKRYLVTATPPQKRAGRGENSPHRDHTGYHCPEEGGGGTQAAQRF